MSRDGTDKTIRILQYIEEHWAERHYAPSLRDIKAGCGISSLSVVAWNVGKLERRGKINRTPEIARSITLRGRAGW
jgi:SOS-response transcriptional repressor LexA